MRTLKIKMFRYGKEPETANINSPEYETRVVLSTGAVDKNGAEIFEGDITSNGYIVTWNQLHFAFMLKEIDGHDWKEMLLDETDENGKPYPTPTDSSIEVIGNIYEYPKL